MKAKNVRFKYGNRPHGAAEDDLFEAAWRLIADKKASNVAQAIAMMVRDSRLYRYTQLSKGPK